MLPRLFPVDILFPALLAGQFFGFNGLYLLGHVREKTARRSVTFLGFGWFFGLDHSRFFWQWRSREATHGDTSGQKNIFTRLEKEGALLICGFDADIQQ